MCLTKTEIGTDVQISRALTTCRVDKMNHCRRQQGVKSDHQETESCAVVPRHDDGKEGHVASLQKRLFQNKK